MKQTLTITKSKSIMLSLVCLPLLVGCGGGSSGTDTASTVSLTGTVPGTKIEAFCDDGTYKSVHSTQNGTSKHPFSLNVPKDTNCQLVMTTNEDNADQRVITPITFKGSDGTSHNSIRLSDHTDIGYVDLPMEYTTSTDSNNDHVRDEPLEVTLNTNDAQTSDDTSNPHDNNNNDTIDLYEDEDNDHVVNAYDTDYHGNDSGDNDSGNSDSGSTDSGSTDSGSTDSGNNDSSDNDSSDNDSGNSDSGSTDSGSTDSGSTDSGSTDSGNNDSSDNDSSDNDSGNNDSGGNGTDGNGTTTTPSAQSNAKYMLTAWNDLGMHCMDGNDFSVFSVLPPYNNLHAQIKDKVSGKLITSGITITYQSAMGSDNKWNTTSLNATDGSVKTNFWNYVTDLFGATLDPDTGLTGNPTSSNTAVAMTFNATHQWWEAEGIPMTPYNDDGTKNYYPLVRVVAKDASGTILGEVETVLPVSDEMDCKRCHASTSGDAAKPSTGWVNDTDAQKDYKYNILRLHDQKHPTAVSDHTSALAAKSYNYDSNGLEATARAGTPVLCVACHKSNALPGVGIELKSFTQAIHSRHASVTDPLTGKTLGDSANRTSCYACHPGAQTECLRGAMGDAKNADGTAQMQCQSCHGHMSSVGASGREGWLEEPNCQACHHDGARETSAIDPATNTLRHVVDTRFATNLNTPSTGKSLYRFSTGHGNLQCEACHGSTHAIYPAHEPDNRVSMAVQGHTGTIAECTACHTSVPNTTTGGPHGMHPVGSSWRHDHQDAAERDATQCKACHGADYRGSPLSKMWTDRTSSLGSKFVKGYQVSCYSCHNGPDGD